MDPTGILIGVVGLLMVGAVVHLVTRAASRGAIELNTAIGIRTRHTTSSPGAWVRAHGAALPLTRAACVLACVMATLTVATLLVARLGDGPTWAPFALMGVGYVGVTVTVLLAVAAGNRAVRESQ